MTDFKTELRHRCRHPRCRSKLPSPVTNPREAFCCRGCYESFYLHRCRVCECSIEQPKRGQRVICKKARCRNAFRDKSAFGCYAVSSDAGSISKAPINAEALRSIEVGQGSSKPAAEHWTGTWAVLRVVAGPSITSSQYHCAIVGAGDAITENDRANAAHRRSAKVGKHGYRRGEDVVCAGWEV